MENPLKFWYKTWWGIIAIACLTVILAFVAASGIYFYKSYRTAKSGINRQALRLSGEQYPAADGTHYWLGAAKAPITIVEFGDFACVHTLGAFPTIREISLKYKNDIKYVWRNYPVIAEYSVLLALGAKCAGEQGLFWPMHDKLFQNQGVNSADQLTALAGQIGADTARFNSCLNQQKYLTDIKQDLSDGQTFGIKGTPTFFINGYKVEGNIPYDTFIKIIEGLKK
ncbi:MAG: thioredoxin domain-containing protein [bacterium]|nr:thioredoxin domain-containing protein [bacterium]